MTTDADERSGKSKSICGLEFDSEEEAREHDIQCSVAAVKDARDRAYD